MALLDGVKAGLIALAALLVGGTAAAAEPGPVARPTEVVERKDAPDPKPARLEAWEVEAIARLELLENLELLEKLELVEDLPVLRGEGGGT